MKTLKALTLSILAAAVLLPLAGRAEDKKTDKTDKPKPYPLKTCITDGEKLGSMGKPYTFVYEGREIKLCCEGCKDDFKKDAAKYMKKLDEADKAAAKK